jgi:predicted nucleic acid-binding protein
MSTGDPGLARAAEVAIPVKVLIDANVLYRTRLRELVLAAGAAGLFQPLWSRTILAECVAGLIRNAALPKQDRDGFLRMFEPFARGSLVFGYHHLEGIFGLPDSNDEHVLAAAVHAEAKAVVTFNLRDFPAKRLRPHGMEVWTPDMLFRSILARDPVAFGAALEAVRTKIEPLQAIDDYLAMLRRAGLRATVRDYLHARGSESLR